MIATLKEISKLVGVHATVISRVLNGDPTLKIKDSTRKKILDTVEELNYKPNRAARNLKLNETKMLGIVIPNISNPVYSEIIESAEAQSAQLGYSLLIYSEHNKEKYEFLKLVRDNHVDGLLIASHELDDYAIEELKKIGKPFVLVNGKRNDIENYVALDDKTAGQIATEHLLSLNHKRIAHISGPTCTSTANQRLEGYKETLSVHHIEVDSSLIVKGQYSMESGYYLMTHLMNLQKRPTAVFAGNILIAMGVLQFILNNDDIIEKDFSVIGVHDTFFTPVLHPSLTTVHMPLKEMGKTAIVNLVKTIESKESQNGVIIPGAELVLRESTKHKLP